MTINDAWRLISRRLVGKQIHHVYFGVIGPVEAVLPLTSTIRVRTGDDEEPTANLRLDEEGQVWRVIDPAQDEARHDATETIDRVRSVLTDTAEWLVSMGLGDTPQYRNIIQNLAEIGPDETTERNQP